MTELIWQGKYDKEDRKTAPVRIALPFQVIETVNLNYYGNGAIIYVA